MKLPDNVLKALMKGRKIEAITLLRSERNIDLKKAKEMVESCQIVQRPLGYYVNRVLGDRTLKKVRNVLIAAAVIASFVWAMVNSVNVVASVIVLLNHGGYKKAVFTVEKLYHTDDHESGLTWGFTGMLVDRSERLYAPGLADAKTLKYRGLRKMFPPGAKIDVWYNAQVTEMMFKSRTLRVIPYTPDLVASETEQILWWGKYCLLPFVVILILAGKLEIREPKKRESELLS